MGDGEYDANGNHVWAAGIGGNQEDHAQGLDIDDNDNVYVTGMFQSDVCNITGFSDTLAEQGHNDTCTQHPMLAARRRQ